jgi:hypothetical protein
MGRAGAVRSIRGGGGERTTGRRNGTLRMVDRQGVEGGKGGGGKNPQTARTGALGMASVRALCAVRGYIASILQPAPRPFPLPYI